MTHRFEQHENVQGKQSDNDSAVWARSEIYTDLAQSNGAASGITRPDVVKGDVLDFGDSSSIYGNILRAATENKAAVSGNDAALPTKPSSGHERETRPGSFGPDRRSYAETDAPRDIKPNQFGPDRREFPLVPNNNLTTDETFYSFQDDKAGLASLDTSKTITLDKDYTVKDLAKSLLGPNSDQASLDKLSTEIAKLNGLKDISTLLKKGQEIQVPTNDKTSVSREHEVKEGESLWKIARKELGKDATPEQIAKLVKEIIKLNPELAKNPDHIEPKQKIKLPGDKSSNPDDKTRPGDKQFNSPERERLYRDAEEAYKNDPAKLKEFRENMKRFEERAKQDGLSPEEVRKTYKEVGRLLETKGDKPVTAQERSRLASDVIRQAANPYSVDQGQHNTCNMNTVEVRMYKRNPSEAAKLVTDVATTGQYTTKDGITVKIDPKPHHESTNNKPNPGDRSYASEIFQVTSANIHLSYENKRNGTNYRYEQREPVPGKPGNGEVLLDYSTNPPTEVDNSPNVHTGNLGNLRDVYASITGKREVGTVVGHSDWVSPDSDGVKTIRSEKELHDYLAQCKREGKFPITIAVDTTNEPFWSDSGGGAAGGSGGGHVVNITDYQPGPPAQVTVDNSWGPGRDHDARAPLSVHDVYIAMRPGGQAIDELRNDVDWNRKNGKVDHWKEFELLRMERNNGKLTDEQYEKKLVETMRQAKKDWEKNPDAKDKQRAMQKLDDLVRNLNGPPDRVKKVKDEIEQLKK